MPRSPDNSVKTDLGLLDPFWREPVTRDILPNGLTLIVKPDRSAALASVQVWVRTGSIHEGRHLGSGLSHYLEHMLFKGTDRRSAQEISATVQAHGGYINAYTTFDHTVYYIDLPSEHTALALDILADAVLRSRLPADEAVKEKDVILREIAMTRDDPDGRLWEAVFAAAFREHPYRQPVIGHRDVFAALSPEDLVAYHRARYVPENLVVVVVGDVDPAAVRSEVDRQFGPAKRTGVAPVLVSAEPLQLAPREDRRREDVEIVRGVLTWPIPGLSHPDAPVLDLLSIVLGQGDSSVLWREVRDQARLVHTVDASSWNPGSSGLFCVSYTADAGRREAAEAAVEKSIGRRARSGFTARELGKAVRQLAVGEVNARKTMSGQASRLGAAEVVVGDLGYSRAYFERLRAVDPADLRRVLRTYLVPARRTAVSIEPSGPNGTAREATPKSAAASAVPDFVEQRLPNGARLLIQTDRRLPQVHLRLAFLGGPLAEPADKRGVTALFATLLSKDTRRRSAAEVAQFIEEVGGSFYPFSGNNSFGLAAEVLTPDAERALTVIEEGALEPAFAARTFETERQAQLAALQQDADDVVTLARKLVRRRFFGAHPLGLDAQGDEAGVRALSRADVVALHRRLCVASNVVLAVAGDVPPRLIGKLKAFLGRFPKDGPVSLGASPPAPVEQDLVERQPREQAVVLQAFPSPSVADEDFPVGEVADELFSGMASRLFERVREEKGLAYFVRSSRVSGLDSGMFYFYAGTAPGKEAEVLAEIDAEIARVQSDGVEEAELRRCQARLKAGRRQALQSSGARALQSALDVLQGRTANEWKTYDARIDAVTVAALGDFARKYFRRGSRTQLVVRP